MKKVVIITILAAVAFLSYKAASILNLGPAWGTLLTIFLAPIEVIFFFFLATLVKPINEEVESPDSILEDFDWDIFSIVLPIKYREVFEADIQDLRESLERRFKKWRHHYPILFRMMVEFLLALNVASVFYHAALSKLELFFDKGKREDKENKEKKKRVDD